MDHLFQLYQEEIEISGNRVPLGGLTVPPLGSWRSPVSSSQV